MVDKVLIGMKLRIKIDLDFLCCHSKEVRVVQIPNNDD